MLAVFSHMLLQVVLHDTVMQLSIVQQEFRAPPTFLGWTSSKQENCVSTQEMGKMDTKKSVSFPIDGGFRTLKNRSGIHLFCQKENLPAGVAYKNLAILSCAAVLLEHLTRRKANLLKLRSRPGIARYYHGPLASTQTASCTQRFRLVPRESCSFIYAKRMNRNVYCQVCFAMKLSCWQHRAAFIFLLVNARTRV